MVQSDQYFLTRVCHGTHFKVSGEVSELLDLECELVEVLLLIGVYSDEMGNVLVTVGEQSTGSLII